MIMNVTSAKSKIIVHKVRNYYSVVSLKVNASVCKSNFL